MEVTTRVPRLKIVASKGAASFWPILCNDPLLYLPVISSLRCSWDTGELELGNPEYTSARCRYFWVAVMATVAGILCACSLWRRHSHGSLCCRDSSRDERASEPDSNGSCYAPPQYSRCNSFHQPPPPYSEVRPRLLSQVGDFLALRWLQSLIYTL